MSIFGRSPKDIKPEEVEDEAVEFPFQVLWQDEEQSNLIQYLLPAIQIILLVWILIKIK